MFQIAVATFALLFSSPAQAQEDQESVKKSILDKVRKKLEEERVKFLKRVEQIIDEELGKKKPENGLTEKEKRMIKELEQQLEDLRKKQKEMEREKRVLDEKIDELRAEAGKIERMAADAEVRAEAAKKGPKDEDESKTIFDEALKQHDAKNFDVSIRQFKIIYYAMPKTATGVISAYNIACGYALQGKKDHAIDWLEISINGGYQDYKHMREDKDLDSLRNERRYKKLFADK